MLPWLCLATSIQVKRLPNTKRDDPLMHGIACLLDGQTESIFMVMMFAHIFILPYYLYLFGVNDCCFAPYFALCLLYLD